MLPFYQHVSSSPTGSGSVTRIMEDILNPSVSPTEAAPIELHLIKNNSQSLMLLRWFHPVCDAKGAELALHHLLQETAVDGGDAGSAILQLMGRWSLWKKIQLAYQARKNIQYLDRLSSLLPPGKSCIPDRVNIRLLRFNPEESVTITKLARQQTGLAGTSLYFIGCMMRAVEQAGSNQLGNAYCVPYAMNLRKRKSLFPVFGNQVSFLFAQASQAIVNSRDKLFKHLLQQNKAAIKAGLDRAMLPLMQAGSWLPLDKYGKIVRHSPQGRERSSFWFSYTGSMDPEPQMILKCPVVGVSQFSQVTAPPSLGLLVNVFQGRVVLSFNYVANQFEPAWLDELLMRMKAELLGVDGNKK